MSAEKSATWRQENFGRLLLDTLRLFETKLHKQLEGNGFQDVRIVHLQLMRNVDDEGTTVSEIAARAGYTKQAASQIAVACAERDLVVIEPSTTDRRSKIVKFTRRGQDLITRSRQMIAEIEQEFSNVVGSEDFALTSKALAKLRNS